MNVDHPAHASSHTTVHSSRAAADGYSEPAQPSDQVKHADGGSTMVGGAPGADAFPGGVSMRDAGVGASAVGSAHAPATGILGRASVASAFWTTGDLARVLGATLVGRADLVIHRVGHVDDAAAGTLAFFRDQIHARKWLASGCPAAIASAACAPASGAWDPAARALLVVPDADLALLQVLRQIEASHTAPAPGIHPSAVIHADARVAPTASIGPGCVIGAGASIGERATLLANVTIGPQAVVGEGCLLHSGVCVLDRCTLGRRVILQANAVIGSDGFGYVATRAGLVKLPHVGHVEIDDDVEIGACTCVDRAKFGVTRVGAGSKIDNLVQVAHNCVIGHSCVICGSCGLAGSVTLGDGVVLGGKVGVADGVTIGSGARIAGYAGVAADVPPGAVYMGTPAGPATEWRRIYGIFRLLPRLMPHFKRILREDRDAGDPAARGSEH